MSKNKLRFKDERGNDYANPTKLKIADVTENKSSNLSANSLSISAHDKYEVYGAVGKMGKISTFQHPVSYVAVLKDGAGAGRILRCEPNSSILGTLTAIYNKPNINLDYLYYLMTTLNLSKGISGSTIPHIYYSDYKETEIVLPSLPEQQKIADFLSKLDLRIEKQADKVANLKDYKKGLQQAVFGINGERTLKFKDAQGKDYPEWEEKTLGDMAKINMGFTPSTKEPSNWGGDIVWVAISDLNNHKYIENSKKKITKIGLGRKKIVPVGTLIMSFKLTIGKIAITKKELTTNEAIANFEFKENILTDFMYYVLENKDFDNEGIQAVKGKTLNKESLSEILISLPCLEEQTKIADLFSKIDQQIEKEETLLETYKEQKQGFMQRMF